MDHVVGEGSSSEPSCFAFTISTAARARRHQDGRSLARPLAPHARFAEAIVSLTCRVKWPGVCVGQGEGRR